jgi:IS5 family transposase
VYPSARNAQSSCEAFQLPFGGKLDPSNRWVLLSDLIPWEQLEAKYAPVLNATGGAPAQPFRMSLGALCIQRQLGVTDRETVALITESPYLQFFIGLKYFQDLKPFDASMMVYFRKSVDSRLIRVCNKLTKANQTVMVQKLLSANEQDSSVIEDKNSQRVGSDSEVVSSSEDASINQEAPMFNASSVPDDIPFSVDMRLLNEARETTELVIDVLFTQMRGKILRKPRCNRDKARNLFLQAIKKKKHTKSETREAKRFQLHEINRNLKSIDKLIFCGADLSMLKTNLYQNLLVTSEVYRQRQEIIDANGQGINCRIVNLSRPHVRSVDREDLKPMTRLGSLARIRS